MSVLRRAISTTVALALACLALPPAPAVAGKVKPPCSAVLGEGHMQSVHYLRYKSRLEAALNQALQLA